jgi:hypothetical protein
MKKYLLILLLGTFTINSFAVCKWVWVDQDYNTATAPIPPRVSSSEQKQVCDSTLDINGIKIPSIKIGDTIFNSDGSTQTTIAAAASEVIAYGTAVKFEN